MMDERRAQECVRMIEAQWRTDFQDYGRRIWRDFICRHDELEIVQGINYLATRSRQVPTIADLREVLNKIKADERDAQEKPKGLPESRSKIPQWVRRWIAARYLYARFGREQDMRRFAEQGDWGNPDMPLMMAGEWEKEAARVSDDDVWKTVGGALRREKREPGDDVFA